MLARQVLAVVLSACFIAVFTLAVLGRVSWLYFWMFAVILLFFLMFFIRNPDV